MWEYVLALVLLLFILLLVYTYYAATHTSVPTNVAPPPASNGNTGIVAPQPRPNDTVVIAPGTTTPVIGTAPVKPPPTVPSLDTALYNISTPVPVIVPDPQPPLPSPAPVTNSLTSVLFGGLLNTPTSTPPPAPVPAPVAVAPAPVPVNNIVVVPKPAAPVSGTYMGCYKDTSVRALPSNPGNNYGYNTCAQMAKAMGAPYFGMQYPEGYKGGAAQCWIGTTYNKYGGSSDCKLKDSSGRYIGGVWANSVYKT